MAVKVLITGANYRNKGAQSMLFVTVDELKKRIPDCEIYFGSHFQDHKVTNGNFTQICYSRVGRCVALGGPKSLFYLIAGFGIDVLRFIKGSRNNLWKYFDVKKNIGNMDLIVDVSGFALGDKWPLLINEAFLNTVRLAKKHNIPLYIMPQSFGPFNFSGITKRCTREIRELLPYASKIYAREKEGYELLTRDMGLTNVELSYDLVLQNTGIDPARVFTAPEELHVPEIASENAVAVIPNLHCFEHGNNAQVMEHYRSIIDKLLDMNKQVYIFHHSRQDVSISRQLAAMFEGNASVHLLTDSLSCLEYDELVKKFSFIICSRFHGIVHAYRNNVPAIALGWAIKYRELAKATGQQDYIFDITGPDCDIDKILTAIEKLNQNLSAEKAVIHEHITEIQKNNCFECITEWMNNRNE